MTPDISPVFTSMGLAAVFTPTGASEGTACRVIPAGGGERFTFGHVTITAERAAYHVLRAEVGTPTGGTLTVGGAAHEVEAGEPLAEDPYGLLWSLVTAWGTPVEWTAPGSDDGGSTYEPPDPTLTYTAAAAPAGATKVTVRASGWTSGRIRAGDTLTIGGADHEATATVALSYSGGYLFPDVPVDPPLAGALAGGEAVTITAASPAVTQTVRAAIADYEASEIMGGVLAGDRRLIVRADGFTGTPSTSDTVSIDGDLWAVQTVTAVHVGAEVVAWDVQVRR